MTTITGECINKVNGKEIVIHPFNVMCSTGGGYDLNIGYWVLGKDNGKNNYKISDQGHYGELDKTIVVPPGGVLAILAKEYVSLGSNYMGTIHSKARHSLRGIILNCTTVDPNWEGRMTFILRNSSVVPVEIQSSTTFATLLIHKTKNIITGKPQFPQDAILSEIAPWSGDKTLLQDFLQGQTNSRETNESIILDQNEFIKMKELVAIYSHNRIKCFLDCYLFVKPLITIFICVFVVALLYGQFGPMEKEVSGTLSAITAIFTLVLSYILFLGRDKKE
ncbi:dCTP deaminase domain-containing protein [Pseudoalteromonas piscicida]|uniref:dCTP deaminase domain-containing protein n=1 Tax=Pseudoalteromonas piscicida TaxID=43662 RepID=UPI003C7A0877